MSTESLDPLLSSLDTSLNELTTTLSPLLSPALSTSAAKLPLLDKAKLFVLATYAIESLLFSSLRLNGVDPKSHPVFHELNRVKAYFAKIEAAENAGTAGSGRGRVNAEAAGRMVKHGLAGNEKYDRERAEAREREQAGAKRKLEEMGVGRHTRFDGAAKRMKAGEETGSVAVVRAVDLEEKTKKEKEEDVGDDGESRLSKSELKMQRRLAKAERRRLRKEEGG